MQDTPRVVIIAPLEHIRKHGHQWYGDFCMAFWKECLLRGVLGLQSVRIGSLEVELLFSGGSLAWQAHPLPHAARVSATAASGPAITANLLLKRDRVPLLHACRRSDCTPAHGSGSQSFAGGREGFRRCALGECKFSNAGKTREALLRCVSTAPPVLAKRCSPTIYPFPPALPGERETPTCP